MGQFQYIIVKTQRTSERAVQTAYRRSHAYCQMCERRLSSVWSRNDLHRVRRRFRFAKRNSLGLCWLTPRGAT